MHHTPAHDALRTHSLGNGREKEPGIMTTPSVQRALEATLARLGKRSTAGQQQLRRRSRACWSGATTAVAVRGERGFSSTAVTPAVPSAAVEIAGGRPKGETGAAVAAKKPMDGYLNKVCVVL